MTLIAQYGPDVLRVDGEYGQLYYDTLQSDSPSEIEFVNSDTPLRVEGQKTIVLEICESFAPDVPNAIVLPVSSGGHASAVWKGLRELSAASLVKGVPRLYLVQAAACDPIARAYREDADRVTPIEPGETIAFSIANSSPPSGTRALHAVRETDGAVVSVSDEEIREAKSRLASRSGICAESSSATAVAGTRRIAANGDIKTHEDVVAVSTGTGFKEAGRGDADIETPTVPLDALDRELSAIVG